LGLTAAHQLLVYVDDHMLDENINTLKKKGETFVRVR